MDLIELRNKAAECRLCGLCNNRMKPVFAKGSEASEIVVVGMCPGPEENKVGMPFVGDAGKILDQILLHAFDFYSDSLDVYVTNLVKCFVPPGIVLEENWMISCLPYFVLQLYLINPKVIIALGKDVCNFLLDDNSSIGSKRGKVFNYSGSKLICTYHPSYLVRGGGVKHKDFNKVVNDFKLSLRYV
jgi:DNA polymerase